MKDLALARHGRWEWRAVVVEEELTTAVEGG
jgi:hypothetical protein